jgi:hypothetical protein
MNKIIEKNQKMKSKTPCISPYDEFSMRKLSYSNLKYISTAILASALEDADVEFLEENYEDWKKVRILRKKKDEFLSELDLKQEFRNKEEYKNSLFDMAEIHLHSSDIPIEILKERKMYGSNTLKNLIKLTNFQETTLINVAKLHGRKIGQNYAEPTIFDL